MTIPEYRNWMTETYSYTGSRSIKLQELDRAILAYHNGAAKVTRDKQLLTAWENYKTDRDKRYLPLGGMAGKIFNNHRAQQNTWRKSDRNKKNQFDMIQNHFFPERGGVTDNTANIALIQSTLNKMQMELVRDFAKNINNITVLSILYKESMDRTYAQLEEAFNSHAKNIKWKVGLAKKLFGALETVLPFPASLIGTAGKKACNIATVNTLEKSSWKEHIPPTPLLEINFEGTYQKIAEDVKAAIDDKKSVNANPQNLVSWKTLLNQFNTFSIGLAKNYTLKLDQVCKDSFGTTPQEMSIKAEGYLNAELQNVKYSGTGLANIGLATADVNQKLNAEYKALVSRLSSQMVPSPNPDTTVMGKWISLSLIADYYVNGLHVDIETVRTGSIPDLGKDFYTFLERHGTVRKKDKHLDESTGKNVSDTSKWIYAQAKIPWAASTAGESESEKLGIALYLIFVSDGCNPFKYPFQPDELSRWKAQSDSFIRLLGECIENNKKRHYVGQATINRSDAVDFILNHESQLWIATRDLIL